MVGYRVDPAELRRGDIAAAHSAGQARVAVERLHAAADALFATGWSGPAASAFEDGWRQWLAGARDLLAALDETAALLGSAGTGYGETDADVRAAIAGALA